MELALISEQLTVNIDTPVRIAIIGNEDMEKRTCSTIQI